jgi:hypothetical protein
LSLAAREKKFHAGKSREKNLDNALTAGVITPAEHKLLQETDRLRRDVIMVDAFPQTQPQPKPQP